VKVISQIGSRFDIKEQNGVDGRGDADNIRPHPAKLDDLTHAELALSILKIILHPVLVRNGPCQDANVSVPTVARMVQKLGYKGYPDFQAELRENCAR
jgi:hypothetical protein